MNYTIENTAPKYSPEKNDELTVRRAKLLDATLNFEGILSSNAIVEVVVSDRLARGTIGFSQK